MFSLAPYRVSVSETNTGKSIPLWDQDGNGLLVWIHDYLYKKLGKLETRPEKRMVRVSRVSSNRDKTLVCGRLQTGEYGFTSELVDSTSSSVSHERTDKEAEMIPFYFCFVAPMQSAWSVLILQRFKNLGIYDFLIQRLVEDFSKACPGLRLVVERLIPSTLAKALLNDAQIKAFRLISHKMPKAVEDALKEYDFEGHVSTTEIVIKATRQGGLPKLEKFKEVLDGKANLQDVVTMDKWDYDTVKLDLEVGGRRRTVDIGKPYKVTPNIDVSDDVQAGADGHPVWEDVVAVSVQLASDYLSLQHPGIVVDAELVETFDAPKIQAADLQRSNVAA